MMGSACRVIRNFRRRPVVRFGRKRVRKGGGYSDYGRRAKEKRDGEVSASY